MGSKRPRTGFDRPLKKSKSFQKSFERPLGRSERPLSGSERLLSGSERHFNESEAV